ncbi:MAG: type II secretion system protein [Ruminococcus sp.]|nr:type II secretion system protein [Ruminococcus sp.]
MRPRRCRLSGATLVEVMVSVTILVILVGVSGTMLVSGLNVFYKSAQLRAAQDEAAAVYDLLAGRMYAADVCWITEEPLAVDEQMTQLIVAPQSVTLHRYWEGEEETVTLMDEDAFGEHSVCVRAAASGTESIRLTVEIYHADGSLLYARQGIVPLLNGAAVQMMHSEESTGFVLTCTADNRA